MIDGYKIPDTKTITYTIEGNDYELKTVSDYIEDLKKAFNDLEENKGLTEDDIYLKLAKEKYYPCRWFKPIKEWSKTSTDQTGGEEK